MKRISIFAAVLAVTAGLFASCSDVNVEKDLEHLTNRVTLLENQMRQVNSDINLLNEIANGASITSFEQVGENEYNITLGNGTRYTIETVGDTGIAGLDLSIDEEGYWVLNGYRMTDANGEEVCAKGSEAEVPVFGVDADGYWTVKYGEDGTPEPVLDAEGNPVKAQGEVTGGGLITSVSELGGKLTIVLNDDTVYSVPVIPGFYCRFTDAPEDIIQFVYGEEKEFPVEMKDVVDVAITVPNGWEAWFNDDNTALTVKAPAAATKAAIADTRRDVVLKAEGPNNTFAISKIKVEAVESVEEPSTDIYRQYSDGKDIVIAGVTYNKTVYGDPVLLTAESGSSVDLRESINSVDKSKAEAGRIFFLQDNGGSFMTSSGASDNTNINGNVVIVSADASRKVKVTLGKNMRLFKGSFTAQNIDFEITADNVFEFHKSATEDIERLHFDGCEFHNITKNFMTTGATAFAVKSIVFEDSKLELSGTDNKRILHFGSTTVLDKFTEIRFRNNIIYNTEAIQAYLTFCETGNLDIFSGTGWDNTSVILENNTLYNLPCSRALLYFYKIGHASICRNIFYVEPEGSWSDVTNIMQTFMPEHPASGIDVTVEDNIVYGLADGKNWQICNPSSTFIYPGSNIIEKSATDPFSVKDTSTGTFTQGTGFAAYGARF